MTRKEAIKRVKGYLTDLIPSEYYDEVEDIMTALEQEPCEYKPLIIDKPKDEDMLELLRTFQNQKVLVAEHDCSPSVTLLAEPCDDAISRQTVSKLLNDGWRKGIYPQDAIMALPSVTPKFTDTEIQKMQDLEQAQLDKAYELGKAEMQPCEDYISKAALLARIDEERKHLLDLKMDGAEHILVHHARRIIEDMPSVTLLAEPCDDTISRKDVMAIIEWAYDECKIDGYTDYCEMRDMVKVLPSVTPKASED